MINMGSANYIRDVERVHASLCRLGYFATGREAISLWQHHSTDYDAGWLVVTDDEDALDHEVKEALGRALRDGAVCLERDW